MRVERPDGIADWLRADPPPFDESDYAEIRRAAWRQIEARRTGEAFWTRLVYAGGGLAAAALAAVLFLAPGRQPSIESATITVPSPLAVAAAAPPAREHVMARPVAPFTPTRPSGPQLPKAFEGAPVRIEFQTANPDVRIIWLVQKGEAVPAAPRASRSEEVS